MLKTFFKISRSRYGAVPRFKSRFADLLVIQYDDYFYSITQVFPSPYHMHILFCSDESEGYPDLTDLGVKLHTLEQRMPWEVSS
jgi:hypothetical protein